MEHSFPGVFPNQHIELTFDQQLFKDPGFVLIYAFYHDQLLFTHHRKRGWELPGGTRKPGEWAIMTSIREVYEETGAELASLYPIGQYTMSYPKQEKQIKTIYVGNVTVVHPLPRGFETDAIKLYRQPPTPESLLNNPDFSPLLKDDVYRYSLPVAISSFQKL